MKISKSSCNTGALFKFMDEEQHILTYKYNIQQILTYKYNVYICERLEIC